VRKQPVDFSLQAIPHSAARCYRFHRPFPPDKFDNRETFLERHAHTEGKCRYQPFLLGRTSTTNLLNLIELESENTILERRHDSLTFEVAKVRNHLNLIEVEQVE